MPVTRNKPQPHWGMLNYKQKYRYQHHSINSLVRLYCNHAYYKKVFQWYFGFDLSMNFWVVVNGFWAIIAFFSKTKTINQWIWSIKLNHSHLYGCHSVLRRWPAPYWTEWVRPLPGTAEESDQLRTTPFHLNTEKETLHGHKHYINMSRNLCKCIISDLRLGQDCVGTVCLAGSHLSMKRHFWVNYTCSVVKDEKTVKSINLTSVVGWPLAIQVWHWGALWNKKKKEDTWCLFWTWFQEHLSNRLQNWWAQEYFGQSLSTNTVRHCVCKCKWSLSPAKQTIDI